MKKKNIQFNIEKRVIPCVLGIATRKFSMLTIIISFIFGGLIAQPPPTPVPGDAEVGTLPGSFSVSPSGAAVYSIPIDLPPGRAGMTPELAFVYNNHTPSTIMGQGWGISGFSSIGRVNPTLYYNNEVDNVDFTDDQLMLDGNRLIESGKKGSTVIYRTEIDEISRIEYYPTGGENNRDYFKVFTKGGLIKEYGATESSRQTYQDENAIPLFWHLNKISDRQGNFVEYTYSKNINAGELHPGTIEYTLFDDKTASKSSYTIEFTYDTLSAEMHQTFYYENQHGDAYLNKNIQKLTEVAIRNIDAGNIIKTYELAYKSEMPLAGEYCLESIKLSAVDDDNVNILKSFNPTTFEWNYYSPQKEVEDGFQELEADPFFKNNKYVLSRIDFDGDGIDEIVDYMEEDSGSAGDPKRIIKIRNMSGTLEVVVDEDFADKVNSLTPVDLDNDGKEELIVGFSGKAWVYKFQKNSGIWEPVLIYTHEESGSNFKSFAGDFTGDGIADMLLVDEDETTVEAELYIGTGIAEYNQCFQGNTFLFKPEVFEFDLLRINSMADFNGDGKTDIALQRRDDIENSKAIEEIFYRIDIYNFNGAGFDKLTELTFMNESPDTIVDNIIYADFNGDGRTDIHHQLYPK